jgi:hypothetical protein
MALGALTLQAMSAGCTTADRHATGMGLANGPPQGLAAGPAARSVCGNYAEAIQASAFPRDAVARGIMDGKVVARFEIDGSSLKVLSLDASDPAFTPVVSGILGRFRCHTDKPTVFEIPFTFHRTP